jgi:predicted DNA-binding transcriptional regulator AlpA
MGKRKQAESPANERILQHLFVIQASLQRIEEWLARIAGVRLHPPAAERVPKLLSREEVCSLLGITSTALNTRIRRGKFPRPAFGAGKRALWREEDLWHERR